METIEARFSDKKCFIENRAFTFVTLATDKKKNPAQLRKLYCDKTVWNIFTTHSLVTIRCCFMSSSHKSFNVILSDNFVHNTIYGLKHVSWTPALILLATTTVHLDLFQLRWKESKVWMMLGWRCCWTGPSCGNWCCDAGVGGDPDLLQGSCHETLMSPDPPATNNIIHCN